MNKLILAFALSLGTALPAVAEDAVWGMWKTEVDDGSYAHIEMSACNGDKTCGWMRRSFDANGEYQSENLGKVLVIGMANQGDGTYKGSVWRPANDKTYIGKMELNGDTLFLDGCVLGGLICKTQTWTRVQ